MTKSLLTSRCLPSHPAHHKTARTPYRRSLNFLNFVKHTDSVDELACGAYLESQARPGREVRPLQQPRQPTFPFDLVAFMKPVIIPGNLPNHNKGYRPTQRNYLCI